MNHHSRLWRATRFRDAHPRRELELRPTLELMQLREERGEVRLWNRECGLLAKDRHEREGAAVLEAGEHVAREHYAGRVDDRGLADRHLVVGPLEHTRDGDLAAWLRNHAQDKRPRRAIIERDGLRRPFADLPAHATTTRFAKEWQNPERGWSGEKKGTRTRVAAERVGLRGPKEHLRHLSIERIRAGLPGRGRDPRVCRRFPRSVVLEALGRELDDDGVGHPRLREIDDVDHPPVRWPCVQSVDLR